MGEYGCQGLAEPLGPLITIMGKLLNQRVRSFPPMPFAFGVGPEVRTTPARKAMLAREMRSRNEETDEYTGGIHSQDQKSLTGTSHMAEFSPNFGT